MKRKRSDPLALRLLRRIFPVIASIIALAAGCTAWVAACSLPQDLNMPAEFVPVLREQLHDPAQVALLLYDGVSRQLSRYGTSGLYDFYLNEICQIDDCSVESVSILMEVESWPVCWIYSHYNHYIATVTFDDFTTLKAELEIEVIRSSWGRHEPSYSEFRAELNRERNYSLHGIRIWERDNDAAVRIKYNRYFGTWFPTDEWYTVWEAAD